MKNLLFILCFLIVPSTFSMEVNLSDKCTSKLKRWNTKTDKVNKRRSVTNILLADSCEDIKYLFKTPNNLMFDDFLYKMSSFTFYQENEGLYLKFHELMEKKITEIIEAAENRKDIEQSNLAKSIWKKILLDTDVEKQDFEFLGPSCERESGYSINGALEYLQNFFHVADIEIGEDIWRTTSKDIKTCLISWCSCLDQSSNRVYGALSYGKCKASLMDSNGTCSKDLWSFEDESSSKRKLPRFNNICSSKSILSYLVTTNEKDIDLIRNNPTAVKVGIDPSHFAKWSKHNL